MSILIKGMKMPDKKNGAILIFYPNGKVRFEDGTECEAVELPPHGRLIDADALKSRATEGTDEHGRKCLLIKLGYVNTMPTIIEAEGEK